MTASGPSDVAVTVRVSGVLAPEEPDRPWPYSANTAPDLSPTTDSVDITLIPYYAWSNRGLSTMRVWLPLAPD